MKKRLLTLLLAAVVFTSLLAAPAAASDQNSPEMLQILALLGVMNGDETGNLNLGGTVTRAEFSKMAVKASAYRDFGAANIGIAPFYDVPHSHWAAGFITTARDAGLITGYLDGSFKPSGSITYAEAVTVVLKLLGYSDSAFTGTWPTGQMSMAKSLGLDKHITAAYGQNLTRGECAWLIYNAFAAKTASGVSYAVSMGYSLDAAGNLNFISLLEKELSGPVVSTGSVTSDLGFTPKTVYRNGELSTVSAIAKNDVLYYIKDLSTVWNYSIRRTGTIDSLLPSASAPGTVVLSGASFVIGTSAAAFDLSSYGRFKAGDTVTLLIGKDNTVAAVVSPTEVSGILYGVVTGTGRGQYTDATGGAYTADYADILGADGQRYRYATKSSFKAGDIVSVRFSGSGVNVSSAGRGKDVSGKVNAASNTLGGHAFAAGVQILDVYGANGITISAARLAGCTLAGSDILFCAVNAAGEIETLILDDFTGDGYQSGVLTGVARVPTGAMDYTTMYTVVIGGFETVLPLQNTTFNVSEGPVRFYLENNAPARMVSLQSVRLSSVGVGQVYVGQTAWQLAGNTQVYIRSSGDYTLSSLEAVSGSERYTLTGWYDKPETSGGRIRLIIAE